MNDLNHPNYNKEFYLECDASNHSVGGHLYQFLDDGSKAAILFMSRTLKSNELNYYTSEKECLAIVYCLNKAKHIILGYMVNIMTDHKALIFLKTCRFLSPRLMRWTLSIQEFNYKILHIPGHKNICADVISRITPENNLNQSLENSKLIMVTDIQKLDRKFMKELKDIGKSQREDQMIVELYNNLEDAQEIPKIPYILPPYLKFKGIIYKLTNFGWKIILPEKLINTLITTCHEHYLHTGADKCLNIIRETFTFKHMAARIRKRLSSCDLCQRCKHMTHPVIGEASGIKCIAKNHQASCDVIGPLPVSRGGVKFILVILDIFTKHLQLYPIKRINTKIVLEKLLNHYIPNFGKPKRFQTDNATYFKNQRYIDTLMSHGIQPIFSPIRRPQVNMAERYIQKVKITLRILCHNKQKKWAEYLTVISNCFNEIPNDTTKFTPNELHLDKQDKRFWTRLYEVPNEQNLEYQYKVELAQQRIRRKSDKIATAHNAKHKITKFKKGDLVLLMPMNTSSAEQEVTRTLFSLYIGPFKIYELLGNSVVNICNIDGTNIRGPFHTSSLRKYVETEPSTRDEDNLEVITE